MYVHCTYNGKRPPQYTCSQYSKVPVGTRCSTQHRIAEKTVLSLVSGMLQAISDYAKSDRAAFIREVQEAQASQQDSEIRKKRRRLAAAQKRAGELERLVCKIYEDNALGRLPDARYASLDAQYAKEQEELSAEIAELEKAVSSYDQGKKSAEKFIALIDKYQGFDTMTNTMLNEFVDKILVHERDRKGCQDTTQTIEIYFNFVGRYIPPSFRDVELTPEEQEAFRKQEKRRDKLHQAYLRRTTSPLTPSGPGGRASCPTTSTPARRGNNFMEACDVFKTANSCTPSTKSPPQSKEAIHHGSAACLSSN